jgi:alcohol dehydrogenase class IV
LLSSAGVATEVFSVAHEPTVDDVERGVLQARETGCDLLVGFGGGSAIDTAKAISAMLTNAGSVYDYLEVVGRAQPLTRLAAPCIAVPTTAGTGAEVTRNSVLAASSHRVKVSLRSPLMLPRVALVDPELTYNLPPAITAATGLDALTQLIEPYVCTRANPITDGYCVQGMVRAARSLRVCIEDGANRAAREDMAVASLFGGLALANSGLGAVHGFAGPIGGAFAAPHGAVCAALLPGVVAANARALRARPVDGAALHRYDEIARLLTGDTSATVDDAITWLANLVTNAGIPKLGAYGITLAHVPALVAAASQASSMKANPIPLTAEECAEILASAL